MASKLCSVADRPSYGTFFVLLRGDPAQRFTSSSCIRDAGSLGSGLALFRLHQPVLQASSLLRLGIRASELVGNFNCDVMPECQ